ncbi:MAG: GGDEF domain-containing phosphodiesterase [Pseudomonadota bacterium]|nr:GGDEF domain-containing phosphodiesterase [Pseudomonadota bacterium]
MTTATHPQLGAPQGTYADVLAALSVAADKPNESSALLLVDVAEVSLLQARIGIESSAALLKSLSNAFSSTLLARGNAICVGDGRYCVIIGAVRNRGHAVLAGEKLLRVADDVMAAAAVEIKPRINIGIALHPAHTSDPNKLLRFAQLAGVAARDEPRRLQVYDEACAEKVLKTWELSDAFAKALDCGDLSVFYQPKIRMSDGGTAGVEALMRWIRDGQTIATPDVFIPLAEEAGLINAATWYVMSNALRVARECADLPVAVNITPCMLHHREFMETVHAATSTWGAKNNSILTLEITEGALMADFEQASARLSKLRDSGFRISIDDFGTGYSSLSYFKKIPADELKIDKSFVLRMQLDRADRQLVETIINLAQQFKLQTVAEGVEDQATYDALARLGCDYAQGFLFSPAVSSESLKLWLAGHVRVFT